MKKTPTTRSSQRKRELTPEEKAECSRLNDIYQSKKQLLKEKGFANQSDIGAALGMGQSAVSHYLNGFNPLNKEVAAGWARILEVGVEEFSVRLAREINELSQSGAGGDLEPPKKEVPKDPLETAAAEITRQLASIPPSLRSAALEAVRNVLAGFASVNRANAVSGAGDGRQSRGGGREQASRKGT